MKFPKRLKYYSTPPEVLAVTILVAAYGLYIIADTLLDNIVRRHHLHALSDLSVDVPLLLGISVLYLSTLLRRQKRTAWLVTTVAYGLYMVLGLIQLISHINRHGNHYFWMFAARSVILPALLLAILINLRDKFSVRSDIQGFRSAVRFVVIILVITVIYGFVGFQLLDDSDFHQEIGPASALHYTIDQFNLTTSKPVVAYTRRAHLFLDSLSFISAISVIYALLSLFQPLKFRFSDQSYQRTRVLELMTKYGADSEEFFKIWPHDKHYFFDSTGESALAFHVYHGVALCLSDPIGNKNRYPELMKSYLNMCFRNDWLPALVHTGNRNLKLYQDCGFSMQKLGQEAIVDIDHFTEELIANKYFRQINNKFNKQGYTYETVSPPHHQAILDRVKSISDEWLSKGSRSERGFALGYYTNEYMQMCKLAIVRDAAGTIQAFANIIPAEAFDNEEATYDLLRQSDKALSNINDFLLMRMMEDLKTQSYKRLNMGLSPLAGLESVDKDKRGLVNNVLQFAYANGDTFFSFSGLYRFKAKYEPTWQDKYVGYKSGIAGFTRTVTMLTRCMSKVVKL
jgi:phosphatidylglycerol lysyltransferase